MTVSVADVREIIDTSLDDVEIDPYVGRAESEVDRRAEEQGVDLDETHRDQIVEYLAAHFIRSLRVDEREPESQNVGGQSVTYAGSLGAHLERTTPGEHALRVSPTGFFSGETYTIVRDDIEDTDDS